MRHVLALTAALALAVPAAAQKAWADNPLKSQFVRGFELTDEERADLGAFLESLTDTAFLTDPRFANPWKAAGRREPGRSAIGGRIDPEGVPVCAVSFTRSSPS